MPENEPVPRPAAPWPRRRFLGAVAATGVYAALGSATTAATAEPVAAPTRLPDPGVPAIFDIHGTPHPGLSRIPAAADHGRFTPEQTRLIEGRLDAASRDRLLLGIG